MIWPTTKTGLTVSGSPNEVRFRTELQSRALLNLNVGKIFIAEAVVSHRPWQTSGTTESKVRQLANERPPLRTLLPRGHGSGSRRSTTFWQTVLRRRNDRKVLDPRL